MSITPDQCLVARRLLGWSRIRLSAKAMVSDSTVRDFETGRRIPSINALTSMRQALEAAGVTFLLDRVEASISLKQCPRDLN